MVSIIERMNTAIRQVEPNKKIIDEMVRKLEKVADSELSRAIKSFDEYVSHLCEVRDEVVEIFELNFSRNIQTYFEKQTKILLT